MNHHNPNPNTPPATMGSEEPGAAWYHCHICRTTFVWQELYTVEEMIQLVAEHQNTCYPLVEIRHDSVTQVQPGSGDTMHPFEHQTSQGATVSANNRAATNTVAPRPADFSEAAWRRAMRRKEKMEQDKWTENVEPTSVKCKACGVTIQLDKRPRRWYYDNNWKTHLEACPCIQQQQKLAEMTEGRGGDIALRQVGFMGDSHLAGPSTGARYHPFRGIARDNAHRASPRRERQVASPSPSPSSSVNEEEQSEAEFWSLVNLDGPSGAEEDDEGEIEYWDPDE